MKQPYVNELRTLRHHIRTGFLRGTRRYRDQTQEVRWENSVAQEQYQREVKTNPSGRRTQ